MYRLPSEAEWEYACRGGATSEEECSYHFYFAKPTNDLSSKEANFNGNFPFGKADKGPYLGRTTKVGSYAPNKVGLYDMHGNVWQWCEDLWEKGARAGQSGALAGSSAPSARRRSATRTRRPAGTASSASGLPEFPSGSRLRKQAGSERLRSPRAIWACFLAKARAGRIRVEGEERRATATKPDIPSFFRPAKATRRRRTQSPIEPANTPNPSASGSAQTGPVAAGLGDEPIAKELTRMKELRSLKLVWTGITDAGTKDLAALQKLQVLDLWGTKVTPDGVKELLPLTNLRDLGLPDMSEGENALRELTAFQHLHRLRLSLRWEEENLRQLAAIKSLRDVNGGSITDETLAALRRVPVWHVFGCAKCSGDPSAYDPKRPTGVDEILSLDLSRDRISDRGLKELTVLKNLRALLLDGSHITAAGLKELASLKHLHTLGLAYNEDGPNCDTLKGLTALPSLRTLHLPGRDLDLPPEGCIDEVLQTLRALNLLHLFDRATGPNGERVSGPEKVVALDLRDLRVTDDGLKALAVLKNLQTLRLGGTKVTAAGLKARRLCETSACSISGKAMKPGAKNSPSATK